MSAHQKMSESEFLEAAKRIEKRKQEMAQAKAKTEQAPIKDEVNFAIKHLRIVTPEEIAKQRAIEDAKRTENLVRYARVPKRHWETKFIPEGRFKEWSDKLEFLKTKLGSGVIFALIGTRGSGKTQIGVELIRWAISQGSYARFTTAEDFFQDIKESYDNSKTSEKTVTQRYVRPKLLVIDELDATSGREWEARPMFNLMNGRYNEKVDTILIANYESKQFQLAVGPKICDRICEGGGIVNCNWPSFRRGN